MTALITFLKGLFPRSCHDRVLIVGGTVRDMLMGSKGRDIDLVSSLSPEELSEIGFRLVEPASTATIYFKHHPQYGSIEITRIGNMAGLEDDLRRRDFTVNAIAMDLSGGVLDPLGGEDDMAAMRLRACGDDSFTCDPLRIFRAFRFEADGWRMAPETVELLRRENWSGMLAAIPAERFSGEMLKALARRTPERFFQRMIECGVGAEFLPELFRMPAIPAGPLRHHPEGDLLSHSIQVLQRVAARSDDPLARFCAFFHDIGKLATDPALYPAHHGHDHAGFGMAVACCNRLRLPSAYRNGLAWISTLHGTANLWDQLRDSTKITMAERAVKSGIARILPLVSAADRPEGEPMAGWDDVVRIAGLNTRKLGIDQGKLESMPGKNRLSFILQKRVNMLKEHLGDLV